MVGKTVKQVSFQAQLGGVVLSVSSNGQRIKQKVGSIVRRAGSALLLEAARGLVCRHVYSRDFFIAESHG